MPTTPNKGYEVPVTGTEVNTWGDLINDGSFTVIDSNLGGIVNKTLSNAPVVLDATESQQLVCRLSGTLTGNVLVTTAAVGMTMVENLTSGAFAVTFGNGVGTPVTIDQGTRAVVITDGTNGPRVAADTTPPFPAGTKLPFWQAVAPTGWTQDTNAALANAAIRIVTSAGGGTGGSVEFQTAFQNQAVSGSIGGTAITIAQMPNHGHPFRLSVNNDDDVDTSGGLAMSQGGETNFGGYTGSLSNTPGQQIGGEGGGQTHTHSFSGTAINLAVKRADFIVATKN